jgi:hypothetical protein
MDTKKKCPMCAEEIPLATVACEFCGAQFKVTRAGYCQNCHTVREADENNCCIRCGTELVDLQIKSEYINQNAPVIPLLMGKTPPVQTVQPKKNRAGRVVLWLGICLILVGTCFMTFKYMQPALTFFLATETPRPTITPRPTSTSTATPTLRPTRTPTPAPVEVTFDTIGQYPLERLVILVGKIVNLGSTRCHATYCGLLLSNPSHPSQTIPIYVNIPYGENTPAPGEMKPLHDNFSTYDIRLRTMDGEYAFVGQIIRVTGMVWETTDGDVCISDIFEIELAR